MSQPKGPAISVPTNFSGDTSKTKKFVKECNIYFNGKPEEFKDSTGATVESKKIWFVLSFMKEGPADTWRDEFMKDITATTPVARTTSWANMQASIEADFKDVNSGKNARTSMANLHQNGGNIATYTAAFRDLQAMSDISDEVALIDLYLNGLDDYIHDKLLDADNLRTLKDYQDRALTYYQRGQQKRARRTGVYIPPARRTPIIAVGTQANPIIVNRERLTPQKQTELRKKGACYRCKKIGHLARDCPSRRNTSNSVQAPVRARQATIQERLNEILKDATSEDIGGILMTVRENLNEDFQETE